MPKKSCSISKLSEDFSNISKLKENEEQKFKLIGLLKRARSCWSRRKKKTNDANDYLILAMALRTYIDYLKLKKVMSRQKEIKASTKKIDSTWTLLCDLKDRQQFLSNYTNGEAFTKMQSFVNKVDVWFISNYGKGIYSSPEVIFESVECSICSNNIKACSHIPGRLYNGLRCHGKPNGCRLRSLSVVENPRDLRCRMWPWEYEKKGDGTMETKVLTTFSIDDFLYSNDWVKNV